MSGHPGDPAHRPELTELEDALRGLAPRPAELDRDAIVFRAGQRAARRSWWWPVALAGSTTTAVVLGVLLALRPAPQVIERIVYVPVEQTAPAPSPIPEPPPTEDLASPFLHTPRGRLQEHLLRHGLDGLGEPPPPPSRDMFPPFTLSSGE